MSSTRVPHCPETLQGNYMRWTQESNPKLQPVDEYYIEDIILLCLSGEQKSKNGERKTHAFY